jgi:hypothetical protein
MKNIVLMQVLECLTGLDKVFACLSFIKAFTFLDIVIEISIRNVFHYHVHGFILLEAIVEFNYVGMIGLQMHLDFPLDPFLLIGRCYVGALDLLLIVQTYNFNGIEGV